MWIYEKRLQFPVNIKETNAKLAQAIISQYGGGNGSGYTIERTNPLCYANDRMLSIEGFV